MASPCARIDNCATTGQTDRAWRVKAGRYGELHELTLSQLDRLCRCRPTLAEHRKYPLLNELGYRGLLKWVRYHGAAGMECIDWLWSGPAARDLEALGLVHGLLDYDETTDTVRRVWVATEYLSPSCGPLVPGAKP